ncbi:MAG TPA: glycosyltransferase, partial [Saprospiraceae bacterium]|nr:glycosyltransferase [Saprospiraceae bacterium]
DNPDIKKAYLVRDGRDALVSLAHHRKDIIEPGTDFRVNLLEAILSMEGSFFGGWSENVRQWLEIADVVIRFEDLIEDPIREVEKLRAIMDLPEPNPEKLPSFQKLKFGNPHYGSGRQFLDDQEQMQDLARKNFRRGKAGGWKEEMPLEYEAIFWELHGEMMEALGYERGPGVRPVVKPKKPYRILVEGSKVNDPAMDGVKRYNEELLFSLLAFQKKQPDKWRIDVLSNRDILSLPDFLEILLERRAQKQAAGPDGPADASGLMGYEQGLLAFKSAAKTVLPKPVYGLCSSVYRALPFRQALRWVRQRKHYNELRQHLSKVRNEYQLIHVPLPQNYYYVKQIDKPFVFTIHDLTHRLFPEFHTRDNTELAEKGMQFISQRKVQAIAVSQATKNDLLKEYPAIPEGRVHVIYEAANRDSFQAGAAPSSLEQIRSKYKLPDKPYLLCLSTLEPRKNLKNTIDAFLQLMQDPANREF